MKRSAVSQLPEDVRAELERRLVGSGFAGYSELAEWLQGRGCEVSRSAVHRHGQALERRLAQVKAATDAAAALVEGSDDDEGKMSEAVLRMVQTKMFDLLVESDGEDLKGIGTAATALAKAARASIAVRNERRKARAEAAEAVRREAAGLGLSAEVLDRIDAVLMPEG